MRGERDVPRAALEDLAVVDRHHVPGSRADPAGAQGLAPLVEEVAQGVGPVHRGLDVDDAVGGVRVQPVEAGSLFDERARRGGLGHRSRDADGGRDLPGRAIHEDGQVGVNVEQGLLAGLAADSVHRLAGDCRGRAGQRGGGRHRHLFGSGRAGRGCRLEGAQRAERGQVRAAGGRGAAAGEGERDADDQGYDDGGRTRARQPQAPPLAPGFLRADLRDALPRALLPGLVALWHDGRTYRPSCRFR